jgi:hypothetical protein
MTPARASRPASQLHLRAEMLDKLHRRLWGRRVQREPGDLLRSAARALRP